MTAKPILRDEPPVGDDAPVTGATRAQVRPRAVPALRTAQPALARQLALSVEHEMPGVLDAWKTALEHGELTDEMVDCFVALGWLSSRQDPRLSPKGVTHR